MMKYLSIWALVAIAFQSSAQKEITVIDTVNAFSRGGYNAYRVDIPAVKIKDTEKDWIDYLKDISKEKPRNNNGEIEAVGVTYKNISPSPFIVYSRLLETQDGVRLTAWFTADNIKFMSAEYNAEQNIAVKKFVRDFAVAEYRKVVQAEVDAEKKKQNELKNKLEDLIKDEDKAIKEINSDKRSISRNEDDIRRNESEQKLKTDVVEIQKRKVEAAKGGNPDILKIEEKQLKTDEGDLKKLQRDNEKMHKEIDNWNRQIRENERNIDQNKHDQKLTNELIEKQKRVVRDAEEKLNAIH